MWHVSIIIAYLHGNLFLISLTAAGNRMTDHSMTCKLQKEKLRLMFSFVQCLKLYMKNCEKVNSTKILIAKLVIDW